MILGYRDRRTEPFVAGQFVRAFQGFEQQAERRLAILNAAPSLDTLRALPSNRLEALRGDRAGRYSIRINQQWRICFVWPDGQTGPSKVEIVGYHWKIRRWPMFKRAVHPGEILKDELDGLGVTPTEFARQIEVPPNRVSQIVGGKRAITGDTALRFGHWFGTDPQFWLNLQGQFDLAIAEREAGNAISHLPTKAGREPQNADLTAH